MPAPNPASATPRLGRFRLTARSDAPDFRDFIYEPALVSLRPDMSRPVNANIRDQGNSNACTGFALAAVIDRLMAESGRRGGDGFVTVSALMLYEMALRYDEWPGEEEEGSSCRGAIKGWYNMGVCREDLYPFARDQRRAYSIEAAKDARRHTIGAYYRLGVRISDYHAALNEVGAVYCSASVHPGWKRPDPVSGRIAPAGKVDGGHAFAIVGYNDQGFWIQNSWGTAWGLDGMALWTYEDWLANVQDAWVFRLALPTPQIWHLPRRGGHSVTAMQDAPTPRRDEIAGHFVHIDDGRFNDRGRYWSNLADVRLTADHIASSPKYNHLLFWAHGGLNSPTASARRIAAMKETFKDNGIYPYHWMYDTGLLEELKDVLIGRREAAEERAAGLSDWVDRLVEKLARVPGRALWREMKVGARLPFADGRAGDQVLQAFAAALAAAGAGIKIHLAGHSSGMILLTWLLQRLAQLRPQTPVCTLSLLAPAGTVDLFTDRVQPFLKAPHPEFRIQEMTIYNLADRLEQADRVTGAYNKSLLYLVSRSFEERLPEAILGMQRYSDTVGRRKLPRLTIHYSDGAIPGARVTAAAEHAGFDNDVLTMNHVLRRILRSAGQQPRRLFTQDVLDY